MESVYLVIGQRVRELRTKQYLTQSDLAEVAGLTRTSITNLEAGRQKIPIDTLYIVATALGCIPHDLMPLDLQVELEILNGIKERRLQIEEQQRIISQARDKIQQLTKT